MKLYLSSFHFGESADEFVRLAGGHGARVGLIMNATDFFDHGREPYAAAAFDGLRELGLEPQQLDLRDYFGTSPSKLRSRLEQLQAL